MGWLSDHRCTSRVRRDAGLGGTRPGVDRPRPMMTFRLTIKIDGRPVKELTVIYNGQQRDAYHRTRTLTAHLARLFPDRKITGKMKRTDKRGPDIEIGPDGHTIT